MDLIFLFSYLRLPQVVLIMAPKATLPFGSSITTFAIAMASKQALVQQQLLKQVSLILQLHQLA